MDALEAIRQRFSCREFEPGPVPDEHLRALVDAARLAPSARAEQPWEFVLVTERETLRKLGEIAETGFFIGQAAACIAVFARADAKYRLEDGSAATENILVAATALGLGACWVAGDKKPYAPQVAELLGAPATQSLVSLVPVGRPHPRRIARPERRALDAVLHRERF